MTNHISYEFVTYEVTKTFNLNELNRLVDRKHVDEIKKAMLKDFDAFGPLEVNILTKNIIDGQHTWTAYTELVEEGKISNEKLFPVHYVEIPVDEEVDSIVGRNSNTKNWGLEDYFGVYYKKGVPSYIKLLNFCYKHLVTLDKNGKPLLRYAATIIKGKNVENKISNGTFTCTDEEIEEAHIKASEIEDIMKVMNKVKTAHWFQPMVSVWSECREWYTFGEWLKGFKYCSTLAGFNRLPYENKSDWFNIISYVHGKITAGVVS